ncbi:MAG: tyrosine-protein phosphatase [Chloroflexi bacterium]|nr:tyrosine-protein phosphatase [Chloroflexota bacterium]
MADVTPERFIALQGPLNFRDLGGYTTKEGRKVRWRKLFRSDGIHSMTAEDVEQVYGKLGVITRIDLRTEREIERSGPGPALPHSVQFHHVPFIQWQTGTATGKEDPIARNRDMYLRIIRESGGQLAKAVNTLAADEGLPAVFHCSAGKDRAGICAAMVLGLLGVDEETIMEDYFLTIKNVDAIMQRIGALPGNEHMQKIAPEFFHPQPKAMEAVLTELREVHGGVENYVKTHGVSDGTLERLRRSLLQD